MRVVGAFARSWDLGGARRRRGLPRSDRFGSRRAGIREYRGRRGDGGGWSWIELLDAQVVDRHVTVTLVGESDPGGLVLHDDVGGERGCRGGDSHGMGLGDDFFDGLSTDLVVTCDERVPGFVSLVVEGDAVSGPIPG